ncbi:mitogen-activated protein kinase kinase kinase 14 isoform X2 [Betta splendens]|uniref:Mitogen-activated protein kinase kinase kinase 14 isoform X2 n=1 Tax=Betta splendens TaxID=158456 RepID=A0A9W2XEQ4_BETSP|nr:mitogen-activated protein kinase kinase kinase 14 isoform X2 [Betta splendens]
MARPQISPDAPLGLSAGSELSLLHCQEEKTETLVPQLSRVMQHGTAQHMVPAGPEQSEEDSRVCIVAQAESEDFQEFSPTSTRGPCCSRLLRARVEGAAHSSDSEGEDFITLHVQPQRKQRRKSRRRRSEGEGEEPPMIRGLWVQEIDWLRPAQREAPGPLSADADAAGGSDSDQDQDQDSASTRSHGSDSDSSCCAEDDADDDSPFDLMHVSDFKPWSWTGSERSMLGLCLNAPWGFDGATHVVDELRGKVTHVPKLMAPPFFRDLMKRTWKSREHVSEGLLFHPLQPVASQYREGAEYSVLHHIQNGSYGDVFSVRDKRTGFQCAAKRIPLIHFSSEEVSSWSALTSPRVVELFGAVKQGVSVVLFMDLKPACLAQLLKDMKALPEDLALHYLHQTLGALEHLHRRRVLHLDIKADNVLLSADCTHTFLCDFGLSETLDSDAGGTKAFRGAAFPGTETHMAPEVARGDPLCTKADVWSSCCMLLHMLNGCHPWIRYYSHPLCLQIVNEPPPLWEVPSSCNNFTAQVFRAGLRKDPDRRASARELRRKTTKALRAVGGLRPWSVKAACETLYRSKLRAEDGPCSSSTGITSRRPSDAGSAPVMYWVSPWRTTAAEEDWEDTGSDHDSEVLGSLTREGDSQPRSLRDDCTEDKISWGSGSDPEVDMYLGEDEFLQKWLKTDGDYEGDWEEEEEEEDEDWDSSSTEHTCALTGLFPLLQKGQETNDSSWGSEPELEHLRHDVPAGTTFQTLSPEPRDDPPSCFSCSESSPIDASDKDSDHSSDDMSSGVFSSCPDGRLEWLASASQLPSHCFQGIDIWIENIQGECLRIRESRQVKVGHVAVGISDQLSGRTFTLETVDRKTVSFDQQITESGLWLRCVPAPDRCQRWRWRIRDGELELRE